MGQRNYEWSGKATVGTPKRRTPVEDVLGKKHNETIEEGTAQIKKYWPGNRGVGGI